jgi:glycosyltransferase involved in cell wall biosynthesis
MSISLIIPAYNEEKQIKNTYLIFNEVIKKFEIKNVELVFIDDASTDNTLKILNEIRENDASIKLSSLTTNCGKGFALRKGMEVSNGEIIVFCDADLELNPYDLPHLIAPIISRECDVVNGSRYLNKKIESNILRVFFNRAFSLFLSAITFKYYTDIACGYKAFRKKSLEAIQLKENRFGIEAEFMMKISKIRTLKIKEVPVTYNPRSVNDGKKLRNIDAIKILWVIIKYRFIN